MNNAEDKGKKLKKWKMFFGVLTIVGIVNVATRSSVPPEGIIALVTGTVFSIFGSSFGATIMTITGLICDFSLIWLIIWAILSSRIGKIERATDNKSSRTNK